MRVALADDAALFREGVAHLLTEAGFEVVATVGDVAGLLAVVDADPPDVVVVDIRMPPGFTTEGLVAARKIRESHPEVGVLVLSGHVELHHALWLLDSEARGAGYLLKDRVTDVAELSGAVQRVAAGGLVIDPGVVARLVGRRRVDDPLDTLSEREREVLAVMAEGRSNQAIGERLFLSPETVESHVRSVFTKLGLEQGPDDNSRVLTMLAYLRR